MSMLTPQGLKGKQYRITGNSYPRLGRPPRRSRRILTVIGSLLALSLIALGGVQLVDIFTGKGRHGHPQACASPSASTSGKPLAAPASEPATAPPAPGSTSTAIPAPTAVTVNVYNATAKSGLAAKTADALKARGFVIGKVGNAPTALDKKVPNAAAVISGPAGLGAATLLSNEVSGGTTTADARTDASVDFVIGDAYTDLLDPTQAAAALALAIKPSPAPSSAPGSC